MLDLVSRLAGVEATGPSSSIKKALEAMRRHLEMDVAYVSQIVGNESVFREVDAPGLSHLISVGDRRSLDDVYCRHILEGRLPELILDTSKEPIAFAMPITGMAPIGSHVSVPIRRANGDVYGMFCCLSATPRLSLNERDLNIFKAFAGLVAEEIDRELTAEIKKQNVQRIMKPGQLGIALQPIVSLSDGMVTGYESLARFACQPYRPPNLWFADAADVGRATDLECLAIVMALETLDWLPQRVSLSVNVSPATAVSAQFEAMLVNTSLKRLVFEITEHCQVSDYEELCEALGRLRARGASLAIDDAGAGFSGLQHILKLEPDGIKLDMSLTRGIDKDPARQALATALLMFARRTGAILVAEGIETAAELAMLKSLGVSRGQGYLLGKPQMAAELRAEMENMHSASRRA